VEYGRLLSLEDNLNEFYTELLPGWGIERQIPIGDKQLISLAYVGAYHWTHTDPDPTSHTNDRLDSIAALTWNIQLLPKLILQPYYRFQFTHYTENSNRNDFFHTLGLSAVWVLNEWASVRAFTSWESRNSTDPVIADYQKFDTGGGLSFILRF
jgi:hypothetical protein